MQLSQSVPTVAYRILFCGRVLTGRNLAFLVFTLCGPALLCGCASVRAQWCCVADSARTFS